MSLEQYKPRSFNFLPPVVKNLLILNGLFFLATFAAGSAFNLDLNKYLSLHYFESPDFRPWQYITYMFMHDTISIWHILFNMIALWMFGKELENFWGAKRFLFFYLFTGIGAAFIQTCVNFYDISTIKHVVSVYNNSPTPDAFVNILQSHFKGLYNPDKVQIFISNWNVNPSANDYIQQSSVILDNFTQSKINMPTLGASGAVFGILAAFGMIFPNTILYINLILPLKAKWVVLIYGAIELYLGMSGKQVSVAHFAHLGGALFGVLLLLYWRKHPDKII